MMLGNEGSGVWVSRGSASALEQPGAAPCAPSPRRRPLLGEGDAEATELQGLGGRGILMGSRRNVAERTNTEPGQEIPLELRAKTRVV